MVFWYVAQADLELLGLSLIFEYNVYMKHVNFLFKLEYLLQDILLSIGKYLKKKI
jgi:hypothetical protein